MAALQIQILQPFSSSSSHRRFHASLYPSSNFRAKSVYHQKLSKKITVEGFILRREHTAATEAPTQTVPGNEDKDFVVSELLAIAEAVADRANMHAIIGAQRDNWNHLLTNSINSITLIGSLLAGISSIPVGEATPQLLPLKVASVLLFSTATGMMLVVNKVQPSQLAEEQRKATWMWKQLERSIQDTLALRAPTELDVMDAMNKVLALEKAYPLPLLPGMLEKFPKKVDPACWWPKLRQRRPGTHQRRTINGVERNGWSKEVEEEMRGLLKVLKLKDEEQYVRLGKVVLNINKTLAAAGPIFAGLATIGSGLLGVSALGPLPALLAVAGGSLATVANTLEHAGQVGMVFELFRNNAGFYRWLQEEIESNLGEEDLEKRENGELFKLKLALQLGRSLSEFGDFVPYAAACKDEDIKEFAGKLF
ncbi:probable F-box protein At4g22030 [Musa acuminata AAA Group]|uniref:probable F-box protein At4g22030 n=1 Tax=Musa acuminata AAA Group TaxID=214697 RepID=UPI0031D231CA